MSVMGNLLSSYPGELWTAWNMTESKRELDIDFKFLLRTIYKWLSW